MEGLNPRRRKVRSPDSEISDNVQGYQKLSHKKGGTLKRLLKYPRVTMMWIWTPIGASVRGLPEDAMYACRGSQVLKEILSVLHPTQGRRKAPRKIFPVFPHIQGGREAPMKIFLGSPPAGGVWLRVHPQ